MKKIACIGLALMAFNVSAHSVTFDKDEDAVFLRKAHMHLVATYFGEMGAMVKGKVPYETAPFSENADKLVTLSSWSHEGFSEKRLTDDSKSKPVIWEKKADFDQKMQAFHEQARKLQKVAANGDIGTIRGEFKATADACGGCHKQYKFK